MTSNATEHSDLKAAITEHLNTHDLLGVMDHRAPADEFESEMAAVAADLQAGVMTRSAS